MSIKLMSAIWEKDLDHSQQSILLAMSDFADDDGNRCYPSIPRLAWKTGYSERQTTTIVTGLVKVGYLKIIKAATNRTPVEYKICANAMPEKPPFVKEIAKSRGEEISPLDELGVKKFHPQGCNNFIPRDEEISPNTLVNHYITISDVADATQHAISFPLEEKTATKTHQKETEAQQTSPCPVEEKQATKTQKKRKSKETSVAPEGEETGRVPTEHQQMFEKICNIVGWDWRTIGEKEKGQVAQTLGILKEAGYTLDELQRFGREVWAKDWRWTKYKQYPTLTLLRSEIGKLRQNEIQKEELRTDGDGVSWKNLFANQDLSQYQWGTVSA